MDTKAKILSCALSMFAVKGFNHISIRDIAKSVGIKESSIYYHFKNKQDIFNHLLADIQSQMQLMKMKFNERFSAVTEVTEDEFIAVALHYRRAFFEAEPFVQFIGMLSIERLSNPDAEKVFQELIFNTPLAHQEKIFQQMMERGIFRSTDARSLAKEYQYAIYGAFMNKDTDQELSILIQRIYQREILI